MEKDAIHPWRWRFLALWIIIFTAVTFYGIASVQSDSARATALERTNCGLKIFLLTARHARINTARREVGTARKSDLEAAHGYQVLADRFTAVGHCKIPSGLGSNP